MHKRKIQGRHGARFYAVQALYGFLMGASLPEVEQDLLTQDFLFDDGSEEVEKVSCDVAYFQSLIHGIKTDQKNLEDKLIPFLDRKLNELTPIEHAVLLIGLYELVNHPETPYKVVINEAILLAKTFGAQDGHKYINGVLDKAAKVYAHLNIPEKACNAT